MYAAKLKAGRERTRQELAAERTEVLAGRRKRKKTDPPPPKPPRRSDPPPQVATDVDDLPF